LQGTSKQIVEFQLEEEATSHEESTEEQNDWPIDQQMKMFGFLNKIILLKSTQFLQSTP
jgi:hypothetical protein